MSDSDSDSDSDFRESPPPSPRKRHRSDSAENIRARQYRLEGKYNDAYRNLFNEDVNAAAARFVVDESFKPNEGQIGAATWSTEEKRMFFASLERLGKDDTPGIARAIGTKSIQEIRQFVLLLEEAPSSRTAMRGDSKMKVTLQDIPAAAEIDCECADQLELSGEALAWFQETFETKQEQARYGDYWLITPDLAEQLDEAMKTQGRSFASSPATTTGAEDDLPQVLEPKILRDIPEAKLLKPTEFLYLSKQFFMNPHSTVSYPWPHWMQLRSDHAREPAIYRTAFTDLHTLVVSLTRRIVQASIVQATSRVRSQGWRDPLNHGVKPFVRPRDVFTAIDLLGIERNGYERWAGIARRCGLRVRDRDWGEHGERQRREVPWDEVEQILNTIEPSVDGISTVAAHKSRTDKMAFKARAMRSGTPLPTTRQLSSEENINTPQRHLEDPDADSDEYRQLEKVASDTSSIVSSEDTGSLHDALDELEAVEAFDQAASHKAQRQLWEVLSAFPEVKQDSPDTKDEAQEPGTKSSRNKFILGSGNWRHWTRYHAEWEELRNPIPQDNFLARKRRPSSYEHDEMNSGAETGCSSSTDRGRKRRKASKVDIPIRGARAYAARMQDTHSSHSTRSDTSDHNVGADVPTQSIEESAGEDQ